MCPSTNKQILILASMENEESPNGNIVFQMYAPESVGACVCICSCESFLGSCWMKFDMLVCGTCAHTHTHIYMDLSEFATILTFIPQRRQAGWCRYVCVCVCVRAYIYIYIYMRVCVYMDLSDFASILTFIPQRRQAGWCRCMNLAACWYPVHHWDTIVSPRQRR